MAAEMASEMAEAVRAIPVALIEPSPYQPRAHFADESLAELAASIRQHGVIQPVIVRPSGPRYQLVAGERRLRACERLGLSEIPAIVRGYTDEQALEAALVENLQREDISVVETARAYHRLTSEFHYTQGEVARRTGKSRAAIANTLRLLQLSEPVLDQLHRGELTEGHARALLSLPYGSIQEEMAAWVARNAVPVRETERKVRELLERNETSPQPANEKRPRQDIHVLALEEKLLRHFGTRVSITSRGGHGSLTLDFYSEDDLWRLLEAMGIQG